MSTRWVLCRWIEGETKRALGDTASPCFDPATGLSFCGPLSEVRTKEFEDLGRRLGFPRDGMQPEMFGSAEEAALFAELRGERVAIDVPAPLDALLFSVVKIDRYDGSKTDIVRDAPFDEAETAMALALYRLQPGARYIRYEMDCRPDLARLGDNRPCLEVAKVINERARTLRAEASTSK